MNNKWRWRDILLSALNPLQVCDFDGRAVAHPQQSVDRSTLAACFMSGSLEQHLVFTGLVGAGPHLDYLTTTVYFSINSGRPLERAAGPMQVCM